MDNVESHEMYLYDDQALAACVLWGSKLFDTAHIAELLHAPEHKVVRTLALARSGADETPRQSLN
jgi:hypothetical protein